MRYLLALFLAVVMAAPASAQRSEQYTVDTTADLVALCSVEPGDEDYIAAINFCYGYAHGAIQYHLLQLAAMPELQIFCIPEPRPTRAEARRGFLEWVEDNPDYMDEEALNALFTYFARTYPCS